MYSFPQLAARYLRYYLTAFNGRGHGMHSPFVFDFILRVLHNGNRYEAPAAVEDLRQRLLQDQRRLQVEDHGAGSRVSRSNERSVSSLARAAVKPRKYGQLLYRLVRHYRPEQILELGTSLGLTTSYLSLGHPAARLVTVEGSEAIAGVAEENFRQLGLGRVELVRGRFDEVLPGLLKSLGKIDLAYVDGNHRYEPTVDYFKKLLPHCGNDTILVFDDIHWSRGMEQAWDEIRQHPSVRCSIDLFFLGFVFFRSEFHVRQHFPIRF